MCTHEGTYLRELSVLVGQGFYGVSEHLLDEGFFAVVVEVQLRHLKCVCLAFPTAVRGLVITTVGFTNKKETHEGRYPVVCSNHDKSAQCGMATKRATALWL